MEKYLDDNTQRSLREQKILSQDEVAIKTGDIFLAENVLTKTRRRIEVPASKITENKSTSGLLKG
jgi:hypothetical protein